MRIRILNTSSIPTGQMRNDRRAFLRNASLLAGLMSAPAFRAAVAEAPSSPFSFEVLRARAAAAASAGYVPPYRPMPDVVAQIDYEAHGKIRFRTETAPFSGQGGTQGPAGYPLEFFHLGKYFTKAVKMHLVLDGQAVEVPYSVDFFDMPEDSPARVLPADSGFAGFRLQEWNSAEDWRKQDWIAFLGASYFRAIGAAGQYGLSARGVALNSALPNLPEEFPDFTEFYIEETTDPDAPVVISALLDGPSVTGAFRFHIRRGFDRTRGITMDIEQSLFLRTDVGRLGLIPLTSMLWYGEYGRDRTIDWRPEVHDSDGLALWTGAGERIWRPLNDPTVTRVSAFMDENPQGFGLLQRDRDFDHYQDGVMYDRRPSLWVEPLAPLGRGAIQLLEIPTDDEIHDNIGAFWVPEGPAVKGNRYDLHYRLHWQNDEPFPAMNIARTVATRIGEGGEPGKPRPDNLYRMAVEFDRPEVMRQIPYGVYPKVNITTSRGAVIRSFSEPVPNGNIWRAVFDLELQPGLLADLRLYLDLDGKPLTETWIYQFSSDLEKVADKG